MRSRLSRIALGAFLVVLVSASTIEHTEQSRRVAPEGQLAAHHHGPHAPCPPAQEHHCLTCAASSLISIPPAVARLAPPRKAHVESLRAELTETYVASPTQSGRSPPAV